jgi:hypothetical protein
MPDYLPLPWTYEDSFNQVCAANGETVAGALFEGDAKLIVLAVNSHYRLVAELRKVEWSATPDRDGNTGWCPACGGMNPAEKIPAALIGQSGHSPGCTLAAALEKATGDQP